MTDRDLDANLDSSESPSADYRFFVYDPQGYGFLYFKTVDARDKASSAVIQSYLDDGWHEDVEQVVAGEVTHTCEKINVETRPDTLDAEDCDEAGHHWGDFETRCDYDLVPLVEVSE